MFPDRWIERVAKAARIAVEGDEAEALETLFFVLCEAPQSFEGILSPAPEASEFLALMENAAPESASLRLLGDARFMLSRGAGDTYLASVILPGMCEEETARADTLPRVLVIAMCRAILARASI